MSLRLEPGQLLALVGENGAGKSTLVRMLLRFDDPTSGVVRLGGVPLTRCEPAEARRAVSVVFQDFARYQLPVREGLSLGGLDQPDDEALWSALRDAGADGVVAALHGGLDARLGRMFSSGHDLSGGQWQRLALARGLARRSAVLVLDEPTSALDPEGEEHVFRRLRTTLGDRVGVVISHRFSTVRTADVIAVLHQGRLVETGTHEQLLAQDGRYAHLFRLQAVGYA